MMILPLVSFPVMPASLSQVTLTANVNIVDQTENVAVGYAVRALKQDINRRLGVPDSASSKGRIVIEIDQNLVGFDRHVIDISQEQITISGSDELGTIHGIYDFSERHLGIDPTIFLTGILPESTSALQLPVRREVSKPYTFRHRGVFFNDHDLLIGFQMEQMEDGFNLTLMEKYFETVLRLKGTSVVPSTLVLPDEQHLKLASDMGLYISQMHAEPLGSQPYSWNRNFPYTWKTQKEHFTDMWSKAIKRQAGRKVLWTLGFRGYLDSNFWNDDPSMKGASDEQKAEVINEVVATQYELIKKIRSEESPETVAYTRGLRELYSKNLLKYPSGTTILSGDNFDSQLPEGLKEFVNTGGDSYKYGIYMHINGHNRRSHARISSVPPEYVHDSFDRAVAAGMTDMLIINVGNMKEKVFGLRQMFNYGVDYSRFREESDGSYYYKWYVKNVIGSTSDAVSMAYRALINSATWGDENYFFFVEHALSAFYMHDAKYLERLVPNEKLQSSEFDFRSSFGELVGQYKPRFSKSVPVWEANVDRALAAESELGGSALSFYRVDAVLPTRKSFELDKAMLHFVEALEAYFEKDYHKAHLQSYQALRAIDEVLAIEKEIEDLSYGKFDGWYDNDKVVRNWHTKKLLTHFHNLLVDTRWLSLPYQEKNPKMPALMYQNQPTFDSNYRGELFLQHDSGEK